MIVDLQWLYCQRCDEWVSYFEEHEGGDYDCPNCGQSLAEFSLVEEQTSEQSLENDLRSLGV